MLPFGLYLSSAGKGMAYLFRISHHDIANTRRVGLPVSYDTNLSFTSDYGQDFKSMGKEKRRSVSISQGVLWFFHKVKQACYLLKSTFWSLFFFFCFLVIKSWSCISPDSPTRCMHLYLYLSRMQTRSIQLWHKLYSGVQLNRTFILSCPPHLPRKKKAVNTKFTKDSAVEKGWCSYYI